MTMPNIGLMLEELCQSARMELVLIAPFIKQRVMQSLLRHIDGDIQLTCITRWRPEEIKIGVSDIGVWDAVKGFPRSRMLLRPDLHAACARPELRSPRDEEESCPAFQPPPSFRLFIHDLDHSGSLVQRPPSPLPPD